MLLFLVSDFLFSHSCLNILIFVNPEANARLFAYALVRDFGGDVDTTAVRLRLGLFAFTLARRFGGDKETTARLRLFVIALASIRMGRHSIVFLGHTGNLAVGRRLRVRKFLFLCCFRDRCHVLVVFRSNQVAFG